MNTTPRAISVLDPLSLAGERMKQVLFRPFDLGRWLAIGFTAWLASLGEGGGGGGGGNFGQNRGGGGGGQTFNDFWTEMTDYVTANLAWVILIAATVFILILALGLLLTWVSSRGRFMFLHNVATGRADVVAPWNAYASHGNSLFLFRVVVGFGLFLVILPFLAFGLWAVVGMLRLESIETGLMLRAIAGLGVASVLGLVALVIDKLTTDFVVPIMALRSTRCLAAWQEFAGLMAGNPVSFVLYLLFSLVLAFATVVLILIVALLCCLACCLFSIPYVGTVLLLPVYVFLRGYSAFFLAQFGPQYDVFNQG